MTLPSAVYVHLEEGICSGRGLKGLCEKLTERGFAVSGAQFEVYSFYDEKWITTIRCEDDGEWMKLIPEHWELAYKPKVKSLPPRVNGVNE